MRVLIVEEEPGVAAAVERQLQAAGHATVSCTPAGAIAPCKGLETSATCPLDDRPVEVAVLALDPEATDRHHVALGYLCARRRSIPLVALGARERPEYSPPATALVHHADEVVAAVERVAVLPLPVHSEAARLMVRHVLDRHDLDAVDASVWVDRHEGRLQVHVATSEAIPPVVAQAVAVRTLSAVQSVDGTARAIGISLTP